MFLHIFKTDVASDKLPKPGSHRKPGCYFYLAPQEETFEALRRTNSLSAAGQAQKRSNLTFQAWVAIFTLRRMNTLSAAGKEPKTRTGHVRLQKKTHSSPNVESWPCGAPESAF